MSRKTEQADAGLVTEISRPARHETAVVMAADAKFIPYALFFMDQIARAHPARDFDFCLLTQEEVSDHPLIVKHEIRIVRICELPAAKQLPEEGHITLAAFFRLFAPGILGGDYGRILYLDCDMFYRRGDISKLMKVDLGPYVLAAARDPIQYRKKNYIQKDMRRMGRGYFRYLSAGLLVIDTARYNNAGILDKVIALAVKTGELDQSVLNAVLEGAWAELPLVWNWLYNFRSIYYTELFDPAILHFVGRRKAWNHLNGEYPRHYSEAYRRFFKEHFPDLHAAMPPCKRPSEAKAGHLRYFLRHMFDLRRLVPALDRFDGDFDVKYD